MDTGMIITSVVGGGVSVFAAPYVWRWLRERGASRRADAQQTFSLQQSHTNEIIEQWKALANAASLRADGLEARVAVLEAALKTERETHVNEITELRTELAEEKSARQDAERREAVANRRAADLEHRLGVLEAYVSTHAQLSVAAIQKGLMKALAQRAPADEIDVIVADVVSSMGTKTGG